MTRRALGRLSHRIGRRGAVLLLFSAAFLLLGVKSLTDPSPMAGRFVFYALMPSVARAVLWSAPALLGFVTAFRGRRGDALGFAALSVPAGFLCASYAWSFVGYLCGATPWGGGWISAIEWGLLTAVLLVTSGWSEVPGRTRRHVETVMIEEPEDDDA